MAAFGAVTILMDTLHQNFLQPTPLFPLRNKTKVKLLYKNLSSLRTCLEQYFKVGECDEAVKALEAQMRDVSVELRFQIEHELRLFYLGKSMKLRLQSAQKLLPILSGAIKGGIETMDFNCVMEILRKHFTLPVSGMPPHIYKRVKSFCRQHQLFLYGKENEDDEQESKIDVLRYFIWCVPSQIKKKVKSCFRRERKIERRRYMLLYKAESVIRQELRASYLNKYMKQRIQATQRIRQLFIQGISLTSYIKKDMLKVKNAYHQSNNSQNNNPASLRGLEPDNIMVVDSKSTIQMVGCDDVFNTIMDNLSQQSSKREIVSIVGMGGIGKTTLARRIYEDASFLSHFDHRAWVTISQEYNPRQVFQCLLCSLDPARASHNNGDSNYELAREQVYRLLKHQRYLIVVDDIWSTNVWDDLMRCFQDDNIGSRILLTTRQKNVAEYADSGNHFCHTLPFLDSNESWDLFQSKLCKRLSPEFEKIGREIVDKCKGLPLAIIVAAGLLSNSNQTFIHEWEHIAKCVPALSLDQQGENIIDLSYTFLPHHLKLCFLSFGCFPEDSRMSESEIVYFWVPEGFLKVLRSESMEDVARKNLQDLLDRNLVLIFRDKFDKEFYQMHDVLRELALREAQKENLLCSKKGYDRSLRWKRNESIKSSHISQPWSIQSRICSYNSITPTINTTSLFESLILEGVHAHLKFLRSLRVDCWVINAHNFLAIVGLVHLRSLRIHYILGDLNIHCGLNINYLPLFLLRNLQSLEVSGYSSCEPLHIWGLSQLKIIISDRITLVPPRSVHHNLESIKYLDYRSCTKELFLRIPNLRTLNVITNHRIKCKAPNWFKSLVYLYKVEALEVLYVKHGEFSTIYSMEMTSLENFWPNLKELKLFGTKLKWKDMDVVGKLSKLEVLILYDVKGKKWKPKDGGFRRLRFLKIYWSPLQYWEATSNHFPVLEKLDLVHIKLKEIPSDFAEITTLKSITLSGCLESLISSAKRIQKEQEEYGNDTFVVHIS
ncbi:putative disease resistance RPP13-like protein 3 [Ipomoea triloba]|uniref:putative disease resistance RPP13-like protein 3 n=1 Tax=Ipomoea triloba TaxID=35885 RepID=UPI00125D036B|nr:putative disease resistance RPP13-like protein 3 [Ipomoea triloba]